MKDVMKIKGHQAVLVVDHEIELFRGEFIGLNGGAVFYAPDVAGLQREGAMSLDVFFRSCQEKDVEPLKNFSGKFVLRVDPATHEAAALAAAAAGMSRNQWATEILQGALVALRKNDQSYASAAAMRECANKVLNTYLFGQVVQLDGCDTL